VLAAFHLTHETVEVLGATSHEVVERIPNTPRVHGVAIASEFERGFVNAGAANAVISFDVKH
jgi:hypothetical protein